MRLKTAALLIAFAALANPLAAAKPIGPKAVIAKAVTREVQDDFTKHSQADILAAITPVDINADGIQDWQVDYNNLGAAWCGTGGCRYQLWLGRKNGVPLRVFDRQMRSVDIQKRPGRIVFAFDFHGSECGGFGSQECPGEFTWSAKRGRMILLPTPEKHTSIGNPIDPI
ncbi:MAG: hypothetical protein RL299_2266 [Pseudomonadota bacterium]|jgi:hypothetical protein